MSRDPTWTPDRTAPEACRRSGGYAAARPLALARQGTTPYIRPTVFEIPITHEVPILFDFEKPSTRSLTER